MKPRRHKLRPVRVPRAFVVEDPSSGDISERSLPAPEKLAVSFHGRDISYAELSRMIDSMALGLVDPEVMKATAAPFAWRTARSL
jgi:hypothetical protein